LDDRHGRPRLVFRRLVTPLAYPFQLPADVAADNDTKQRDADQQRPLAELKLAAFTFRRIGFGRLDLHRRIIRDRGQPGQAMLGSRMRSA
jgi:hypothetical protein